MNDDKKPQTAEWRAETWIGDNDWKFKSRIEGPKAATVKTVGDFAHLMTGLALNTKTTN